MKNLITKITANPLLLAVALLIIAVLVLFAVTEITKQPNLKDDAKVIVRVDQARLEATVAESEAARTEGLSGSESLGADQGMLFVSNPAQIPVIVMRDMKYPIDIIWISQGTVSEVTPNAQPQPGLNEDQFTRYSPSGPADQILETNAGWAAEHSVQPGDPVKINSL